MSEKYARRNEGKRHTASKIANPAYIGFARGNGYRIGIGMEQSDENLRAYPVEIDAGRKSVQN